MSKELNAQAMTVLTAAFAERVGGGSSLFENFVNDNIFDKNLFRIIFGFLPRAEENVCLEDLLNDSFILAARTSYKLYIPNVEFKTNDVKKILKYQNVIRTIEFFGKEIPNLNLLKKMVEKLPGNCQINLGYFLNQKVYKKTLKIIIKPIIVKKFIGMDVQLSDYKIDDFIVDLKQREKPLERLKLNDLSCDINKLDELFSCEKVKLRKLDINGMVWNQQNTYKLLAVLKKDSLNNLEELRLNTYDDNINVPDILTQLNDILSKKTKLKKLELKDFFGYQNRNYKVDLDKLPKILPKSLEELTISTSFCKFDANKLSNFFNLIQDQGVTKLKTIKFEKSFIHKSEDINNFKRICENSAVKFDIYFGDEVMQGSPVKYKKIACKKRKADELENKHPSPYLGESSGEESGHNSKKPKHK